MLSRMGLTVVARGSDVRLAVFGHGPGEPVAAVDWWPRACLVFTEYGAWTVRSRQGGGAASAAMMVAGSGGAEYECAHPYGVDDRNLCLIFPPGVAAPPTALVPVTGRVAALRRALRRHQDDGDADSLDAVAWALMAAAGSPDAPPAPGARDRQLAGRLRDLLDREHADPALDAVAAGSMVGLSRTRMIHVFHEVTGTTPHRYVTELRVASAARMLVTTDATVTDVCFGCGFGSVARFQAAFKRAWGMTPSRYRAANGPARAARPD